MVEGSVGALGYELQLYESGYELQRHKPRTPLMTGCPAGLPSSSLLLSA